MNIGKDLNTNKLLSQSINLNGTNEIKILNSNDIASFITMTEAIDLMGEAFRSVYKNKCHVPLRSVVENPDKTITLFFKPAFDEKLNRFAIKFLSQNDANRERGLPSISGVVFILDSESGQILSIMDGNSITSLRTGAVGGLGTRFLARDVKSKFALFGCGAQGRTQLEAVVKVRDIREVYLYDKDEKAIQSFIEEMQPKFNIPIRSCDKLDLLKEVDIITTATGSTSPLFKLEHLKPGVHINAIGSYKPGMQEIAPEIIKVSSLFVDQKKACLAEPGDILIPLKSGIIKESHVKAEIGELVCGEHPGRQSEDEITVFKFVGIAIQDLYVADKIYSRSLEYKF